MRSMINIAMECLRKLRWASRVRTGVFFVAFSVFLVVAVRNGRVFGTDLFGRQVGIGVGL